MKMLSWMADTTPIERSCNQDIRQRFGVAPIPGKLCGAHLRRLGHMLCAHNDSVRRIGSSFMVTGERSKGRKKQRWMDTMHADLKTFSMHADQAHDRTKWRHRISTEDSATKRDKR
ncbi:hypothetical protein Y032_0029g1964 [Ancylostoma ceylanicum]|uniref:Uncharacterized protein n=1 Tax=Ancylostoma ceylanicum TaxID=53326 RepID=A0A016UTY7_9BILA|nr:hypothetical protein Y032_0029g1964 [Ancylostoma ceylanicum]